MTDQKFEVGSTYKVEGEFTVKAAIGGTLVEDTNGRYWAPRIFNKITKVRDRFVPGALYEDGFSGQIYRRTGYDADGPDPTWDKVTGEGGYVRPPETVDEARLVRLYREGEKK